MNDSPPAKQPAGAWLAGRLRQLAALAVADANRAELANSVAVHALRVRMKKMRALLDLAACLSGHRKQITGLRRHCQKIKNALASSRESHVMEHLCSKWFGHELHADTPPATEYWHPHQARAELRRLKTEVDALRLDDLDWHTVLHRHARTHRRMEKARRACEAHPALEALHSWRKRLKRFYYQALALAWLPGSRKRLRRARKLASLIGKDRDLAMLAAMLSLAKEPPATRAKFAARQKMLRQNILGKKRRIRLRKRQLQAPS